MADFLFVFGFETPTQYRNNIAHGWDDEDSEAVFIECADAAEAASWGAEIAERFVGSLFEAAGRFAFSWKEHGYAHGIEARVDVVERAIARGAPRVRVGEMPQLGPRVD
jgi:hypothetical protein